MADPAPIAQTFYVDEDIQKKYVLDGIVTVVDVLNICTRLDEEKPEGVENEAVEQVAFADRVLLNKMDLIEKDNKFEEKLKTIKKKIKDINGEVEMIPCKYSEVCSFFLYVVFTNLSLH